MQDHNPVRCPTCRAPFGSRDELDQHARTRHAPQGSSGVYPSKEGPRPEAAKPRKDREFTRRNPE